ncbi:unnamed protein product [Symbiodinium sp. CCMP2592]|nr:unnamed protein product [Symbiodinium sp. CCMP2592]
MTSCSAAVAIHRSVKWDFHAAAAIMLLINFLQAALCGGTGPGDRIYWLGNKSRPSADEQKIYADPSLVVDPAMCFETESVLLQIRLFSERAGPCMHLAEVTTLTNGTINMRVLEYIQADSPGLQLFSLNGVSVAQHGPACLGLLVVSRMSNGCGIAYRDLGPQEGHEVTAYAWNSEEVPRAGYRLLPEWPSVRNRRQFLVAVKVLPMLESILQSSAHFMAQPEWAALQRVLESGDDWLSPDVDSHLDAVAMLLESSAAQPAVIVELGKFAAAAVAFTNPGSAKEDAWTRDYYAMTTFYLLEAMRKWENPDEHDGVVHLLVSQVQEVWGSDFALAEHRGWITGFGFWDAAAILLRGYWPAGTRPRSRDAGSELLAHMRAAGTWLVENDHEEFEALLSPPPPRPAISWWAQPQVFDPITLRHQVLPRKTLRIAIVEEHRIDYQELRALLMRVSKELFDAALTTDSYFLQERDPLGNEVRPEEWDAMGRPAEQSGNISHLYLLHGIEAGFEEVWSWTDSPKWSQTDLVAGCSPIWACVALNQALEGMPIIVRQNMALLQFVEDLDNLPVFWSLLRGFLLSPQVSLAWKHRLGCEQVFYQIGARPAYVPLISLHTDGFKYRPTKPDVLVHRCSHRGFSQLIHFLKAVAEGVPDVKLEFLTDLQKVHKKFLTWKEFTEYHALVLIPHVPNTISFADAYAMHIPIFLPDEPEIWGWTWSQSDPYAGPGFPQKQQQAPWTLADDAPDWWKAAGGDKQHPFGAFEHLTTEFSIQYFIDRAYWFQYTEYHLLPFTRRFRGIANLLAQLQDYTPEKAMADSRNIAAEQVKREILTISWMSTTIAHGLAKKYEESYWASWQDRMA